MKTVLFISHGSRLPKTGEEIRLFVERLKRKTDIAIFEYVFLDIVLPMIPEGDRYLRDERRDGNCYSDEFSQRRTACR